MTRQTMGLVKVIGNAIEDMISLMAKGGKQNIQNEYSRTAQLQPDPCAYLQVLAVLAAGWLANVTGQVEAASKAKPKCSSPSRKVGLRIQP
jgi:hypothetical protein